VEVLAHDDRGSPQLPHDHPVDELVRAPTGDVTVEREHSNLIGTMLAQQLDAAIERAQQLRRAIGREQPSRMRVERDRDDRPTCCRGGSQ
jgi:hypothetical protein